jgi:hypothetical protein
MERDRERERIRDDSGLSPRGTLPMALEREEKYN